MSFAGQRVAVACDFCGGNDATHLVTKNTFRVVRCRECGLVYVSPRLAELSSLYESAGYQDHQSDRLEHDASLAPLARQRLKLLGQHVSPARLLDVGCSRGWFVSAASEAGWKATGLDVSRPAVESIRARGLSAEVGTIDTAPFAPRTFDVITMFDSIEHMPSPMRALAAARELLADGGVLFVTTPNVDGLLPTVTWQLFGRTSGAWDHPGPPGHIYQFSQTTLRRALERSGFSLVHDATEAMDLHFSTGALEDVIVDVVKRRGRRPRDEEPGADASPSETRTAATPRSFDPHPGEPQASAPRGVRVARRAMRAAARLAAGALVQTVARSAPLLGRGDSLVTLARRT